LISKSFYYTLFLLDISGRVDLYLLIVLFWTRSGSGIGNRISLYLLRLVLRIFQNLLLIRRRRCRWIVNILLRTLEQCRRCILLFACYVFRSMLPGSRRFISLYFGKAVMWFRLILFGRAVWDWLRMNQRRLLGLVLRACFYLLGLICFFSSCLWILWGFCLIGRYFLRFGLIGRYLLRFCLIGRYLLRFWLIGIRFCWWFKCLIRLRFNLL